MPQLDGLRAFAVLSVLATHFGNSELSGYLGVRLFFVLSGFLITSLLLQSRAMIESGESTFKQQIGRFYARRFLRLYPALLVFIVLCVAFEAGPTRSTWIWHVSYLSNILFSLRDDAWFPLTQLWSLSVEEQFYLAWPLLIFAIPRRFLSATCFAAIGVGLLWRILAWFGGFRSVAVDILPVNALNTLGMGALLAVSMSSSTIAVDRMKRVGSGVGLWVFVLLLALYAFKPGTSLQFIWLDVVSATVFAYIILSAAKGIGGIVGKTLAFPAIVYIGKISYGIYLYHIVVPDLVRWACRAVALALPKSSVAQFVIFASVSIALASLSWFLLERPVAGLRRYLSYRPAAVNITPWSGGLASEAFSKA